MGQRLFIQSIIGLICCQILSPITWFQANNALKSGTLPPDEAGKANTARIIAIIGTVFLALGILNLILHGGKVSYSVGNARPAIMRVVPASLWN